MSAPGLVFVKLGGSLITDKTKVEAARLDVIRRVAREIATFLRDHPERRLIIGHGSGSFGHVAAATYQTQMGVRGDEQWMGFCRVSAAALRLNSLVRESLLEAGVPVFSIQPSASTICDGGEPVEMALEPLRSALRAGLTPLVHGDVAFDHKRGGTVISTEQVLGYLASEFNPDWILLAGNTSGVLDEQGRVISRIDPANIEDVSAALGASAGTDVTGGMASKVQGMLHLVQKNRALNIRIFSGVEPGRIAHTLQNPQQAAGTLVTAV